MQGAYCVRVTVIGTGICRQCYGCHVWLGLGTTLPCVDTDARKIDALQRGEVPIYEPGLRELIEAGRGRGGIDFTPRTRSGRGGQRRDLYRRWHASA